MPARTRYLAPPPKLTDRAARLALAAAYRLLRLWWRVRPPRRPGVGVMVWHGGRLLAVRHSYRPGWAIPGGHVDRGESPAEAASRELAEELGIDAPADDFVYLRAQGTTELFALHLDTAPSVRPDGREVIEAVFLTPDEARAASTPLRRLLRAS